MVSVSENLSKKWFFAVFRKLHFSSWLQFFMHDISVSFSSINLKFAMVVQCYLPQGLK